MGNICTGPDPASDAVDFKQASHSQSLEADDDIIGLPSARNVTRERRNSNASDMSDDSMHSDGEDESQPNTDSNGRQSSSASDQPAPSSRKRSKSSNTAKMNLQQQVQSAAPAVKEPTPENLFAQSLRTMPFFEDLSSTLTEQQLKRLGQLFIRQV
jgi:hypothetical protein